MSHIPTIMSRDLYKSALKGDTSILPGEPETGDRTAAITSRSSNELEKYFLTYTSQEKNTILHIAARNSQNLNFIAKVLKRFPSLIAQKNSRGDTALHVSARQGNKDIINLLVSFYGDFEEDPARNNGDEFLWRVKNYEGDTALHIAMKRGKIQVAVFLINLDDSLLNSVNKLGETPLHLAVKFCTGVGASTNRFIKQSGLEGVSLREDMINLIHFLLRKPSSIVHVRDRDGLTPLLTAACCRSCVPIISVLIDYDPQLADQRDLNGRTVLHLMKIESYQEGKRFLEIPEVNGLKDEQDSDGNTPVHQAIRNSEFVKVRVLIECSVDFNIINNYGFSPWDLGHSQENFISEMMAETDKAMNGSMNKQLYRAAFRGDLQFLSQQDDIYLLSRSAEGDNVLHVALGPESIKSTHFVMNILERCPILLCQTNVYGDTPLHLAARVKALAAQELVFSCKIAFQKVSNMAGCFLYCAPWRVRNLEGNTPLHEALRTGNATCARFFIQLDDEVAFFVNNYNETPLHVYAKYHHMPAGPLFKAADAGRNWESVERQLPGYDNQEPNELDLLLEANISAVFSRDTDGLTPLLRAAQCNNLEIVRRILVCCPSSAEIYDFKGRTTVHFMPLNDKTEKLLEISHIKALIEIPDHQGDTPLHMAVRKCHFNKVKVLLKHGSKDHLDAVNCEGELPVDLIPSQTRVPQEILELIGDLSPMPKSIYGISGAEMKENVNILLVIAVLLATITFSACFQVPGGFNQDNGVPILIKRTSFKLFLISETYAMCCSILALFSLIWFMTSKTSESVKLVDLSVFVLQQSFYGTTVAFMTGIYVAVSPESRWTGILVCTFCCGLIVCSLKPLNLLLSRIFSFIHGLFHNFAQRYAWVPCLSCICFAVLSGSDWE